MHTATKTLSQTHIAIAVAVVIGAAGIAAVLVPPLLNPPGEKIVKTISNECGNYGQMVCAPCRETLTVSDARTCTCSAGTSITPSGTCVVIPKISVSKYGDAIDGDYIPANGHSSESPLAGFKVILPKGVSYITGLKFTELKASQFPAAYGEYWLSVSTVIDNNVGNIVWNNKLNGKPDGTLFNSFDNVIKGLPTEQPLIFSIIGKPIIKEMLPVSGQFQLTSMDANGNDINFSLEAPLDLNTYAIRYAGQNQSDKINVIGAERASDGILETDMKQQDDKSSIVILGKTIITLPRGTDSLRRVIFREDKLTTTAFSKVFNGFVLKAEVDGKTLSYSGTTYLDPKKGYIIFGDEAFGTIPVLKGLPTDTKILLSISGFVDNKEYLPINGKLFLNYIQADDGGEKKFYFNESSKTPLALQEYSVTMGSKVSIPEIPYIITADVAFTQDYTPIKPGTVGARIGGFIVQNSTERPTFKITLSGLTAGEKYSNAQLFTNLKIKNSNGTIVYNLPNPLSYAQDLVVQNGLGPKSSNLFTIYADIALTAPALATRLKITEPQKVDLQKFSITKAELILTCGDEGQIPCMQGTNGTGGYGCKKPFAPTSDRICRACLPGQTWDGMCYGKSTCGGKEQKPCSQGTAGVASDGCQLPLKVSSGGNYVYETNPANRENILWEKPNFARCSKDLDYRQWDVTAWKGYVKTSTSALESDPEKCYDEYRSVYKGKTSSVPNYMMYTKVTTSSSGGGVCK